MKQISNLLMTMVVMLSWACPAFSQTDPNFGHNGVASIHRSVGNHNIFKTIKLRSGKILCALGDGWYNNVKFLCRINQDGILDTTFGTSGYVNLEGYHERIFGKIPNFEQEAINALAEGPDSSIYVSFAADDYKYIPQYYNFNKSFMAIAKLSAQGTLDNNFGHSGFAQIFSPYYNATSSQYLIDARCMTVTANNKLIIGGVLLKPTNSAFYFGAMACALNASTGQLDPNFGHSGFFEILSFYDPNGNINTYGKTIFYDVAHLTDGSLLFTGCGRGLAIEGMNALILKLKPTGILDSSFGGYGYGYRRIPVYPNYTNISTVAFKVDVDQNKNIYLGGNTELFTGNTGSALTPFIMRLKPTGTLDSSYGTAGVMYKIYTDSNFNEAHVFNLDTNTHKYLISGNGYRNQSHPNWNDHFAFLARLNNNASLDNSLAGNGKLEYVPTHKTKYIYYPNLIISGIFINQDKILSMASDNFSRKAYILRLEDNGQWDASFGKNGISELHSQGVNSIIYAHPNAINTDDPDNIVYTGAYEAFDPDNYPTGKLKSDGTALPYTIKLPWFDSDTLHSFTRVNFLFGNVSTPDNKWITGISFSDYLDSVTGMLGENILTFLKTDKSGKTDSTYGENGMFYLSKFYHQWKQPAAPSIYDLVPQTMCTGKQGHLFIACNALNENSEGRIIKVLPNGQPDPNFGDRGLYTYSGPDTLGFKELILDTLNNRIYAYTYTRPWRSSIFLNNDIQHKLLRILPNGTTDLGFGHNGVISILDSSVLSKTVDTDVYIHPSNPCISNHRIYFSKFTRYITKQQKFFENIALEMRDTSGQLVDSFGNHGSLLIGTHSSSTDSLLSAIRQQIIDKWGNIVIGYSCRSNNDTFDTKDIRLISTQPNGLPNLSFGNHGTLSFRDYFPANWLANYSSINLASLPDGNLLLSFSGSAINDLQSAFNFIKIINPDNTTGIKALAQPEKASILYPNPGHGRVHIKSPNQIKNLAVYTINGALVYEQSELANDEINLSHLSAGTYMVRFQNGNIMELHKYIKQ